jgi:hypothetical protein
VYSNNNTICDRRTGGAAAGSERTRASVSIFKAHIAHGSAKAEDGFAAAADGPSDETSCVIVLTRQHRQPTVIILRVSDATLCGVRAYNIYDDVYCTARWPVYT